ncbi:hypothetical protein [Ahrensia sp. R2A130]|uniref:hypothetical protein n=1 Tax=Ahrensia sp. R2A130 TaxID=744979 RepID=UPI0001E0F08C|nr:hypothetical protein [Ahrensia sp. R2A130]EFL89883.1 hypothetical protein R2A130_2494 [Ahrensia sp. R2A130]
MPPKTRRRGNFAEIPLLPKYAVGKYAKFPGLAYSHPKPFRNWSDTQMTAAIGGWLSQNPPGLELATLALNELRSRRTDMAASMKFAEHDLEPIIWLEEAGAKVRETFPRDLLDAHMEGQGAKGANIYVMLRGGYSSENGIYGAYVGSTGKPVPRRLTEHRKGIKSARGLPRHGIEPLWSLFDFINPVPKKRAAREEWETRLHEALAPVVPKVTGDVAF